MKSICLTVLNDVGLHARPAAIFVQEAGHFDATIRMRNLTSESNWVDAKSILSVLTLGVEQSHKIELQAEGVDEAQAILALRELVEAYINDRTAKTTRPNWSDFYPPQKGKFLI